MTTDEKKGFTRHLTSTLRYVVRLLWLIIAVVVLAGVGRYLGITGIGSKEPEPILRKTVLQPVPWSEIDQSVATSITEARQEAEIFAGQKIDAWITELMQRVDADFLEWYFSYWTQQMLGLEGLWQYGVNSFFATQPTAAERLTEEIQEQFAKRVLRPRIAELVIERITRETADYYVAQLNKHLAAVPAGYRIPREDWHRYLEGIALTVYDAEGNRQTDISLKALTVTTLGGTVLLAGKTKFLVSKLSGRIMAKSAGKAAAKIAAKTGSKVAAKSGGKFLGPIIGIGVLVWDVWDHNKTKKENRPILRQSIADYLTELKDILLHDGEAGMMAVFNDLERQVYTSLKVSDKPIGR